jgi:hypothetical protein
MDPQQIRVERELFDDATYRAMYPDVAEGISRGDVPDGWYHYERHGRSEGRRINTFDDEFYLRAYPLAAEEIRAGRADSPLHHFLLVGRARGYLFHAQSHRAQNPAASLSPFGGLWSDSANALDIIDGKLEIGQITHRQAEALRFWVENGYVVLRGLLSESLINAAVADLDRAYSGGYKRLKFECHQVPGEFWRPEMIPHPAKALDIHHFSAAVRELIFSPPRCLAWVAIASRGGRRPTPVH